jgi:V8-like Glu-specific endopeptidase
MPKHTFSTFLLILSMITSTKSYGVIFDKDPNTVEWDDPIVEMKFEPNANDPTGTEYTRQLRAIGVIQAFVSLVNPPKDVDEESKKLHKKGPVSYTLEGTGFMITKCHMLTAEHVLTGKTHQDNIQRNERGEAFIEVSAYLRDIDGSSLPTLTKAIVVGSGEYNPENFKDNEDWALLKVDGHSADPNTILPILPITGEQAITASIRDAVNVAGYFPDKMSASSNVIYGDQKCYAFGTDTDEPDRTNWKTSCSAMPGTSGSPVYIRSPKDGRAAAIGMMIASIVVDGNKAHASTTTIYNMMIKFSDPKFQADLKEAIKNNPCD